MRGDGEFGGVVAGAALCGHGEDERAAPGAGQHGGGQLGASVGLDGHGGGAVLQQRDPGQYPGRLAQHQAQRDGVEAGPAVLLGEDEAQQVGAGEGGPQGPVELLRDGSRRERGAGHAVGGDVGEHGLRRLDGRLLFLGEGEVHCLSSRVHRL